MYTVKKKKKKKGKRNQTENRPENKGEYIAQKCLHNKCIVLFFVLFCFYLDGHSLESDKRGKETKADWYQKPRKASTTEQN